MNTSVGILIGASLIALVSWSCAIGGRPRSNAPASAPDAATLAQAVHELEATRVFSWGMGLSSAPVGWQTEGERAVGIIFSSRTAMKTFEAILNRDTSNIARLYALCGIHKLSPERFAKLAQRWQATDATVWTSYGCLGGDAPMSGIVESIGRGNYDRSICPKTWEWKVDRGTNGHWLLWQSGKALKLPSE